MKFDFNNIDKNNFEIIPSAKLLEGLNKMNEEAKLALHRLDSIQRRENTSSINIDANNSNINIGSNITNSFNVNSLNDFIEEIKNSDEDKETVDVLVEAFEKNSQLLMNTINDIKSTKDKKLKLENLKNFFLKIGKTVSDTVIEKVLIAILTRY